MVGRLHWSATYFFCFCLIGTIIISDLLVTPYLLSLRVKLAAAEESTAQQQEPQQPATTEGEAPLEPTTGQETAAAAAATTISTLASIPSGEALVRTVYIESEPFATSNPFLFELLTQSAAMLLLPFWYTFEFIRYNIRLALRLPPQSRLIERMLKGNSWLSKNLAYYHQQFENTMITPTVGSPAAPLSIVYLGLVSLLLLLHTYLWKVSLLYSSHAFCTLVSYSHVLFAFPLVVVILKDTKHGLKIVPAVISFIGLYIFFFPEPATSTYSVIRTVKATSLAISSGLLFSLYLVYYRLVNPQGWMIVTIGFQGLGLFVFGSVIMAALHFYGIEPFMLPSHKYDFLTIVFSSISRFFILYCINEALRWGDPLSVAVSLCLSAPMTFVVKSTYATSDDSVMITYSKVASLCICLVAFSMLAVYQWTKVSTAKQPVSSKQSHVINNHPEDGSPEEKTRLKPEKGPDYVLAAK